MSVQLPPATPPLRCPWRCSVAMLTLRLAACSPCACISWLRSSPPLAPVARGAPGGPRWSVTMQVCTFVSTLYSLSSFCLYAQDVWRRLCTCLCAARARACQHACLLFVHFSFSRARHAHATRIAPARPVPAIRAPHTHRYEAMSHVCSGTPRT